MNKHTICIALWLDFTKKSEGGERIGLCRLDPGDICYVECCYVLRWRHSHLTGSVANKLWPSTPNGAALAQAAAVRENCDGRHLWSVASACNNRHWRHCRSCTCELQHKSAKAFNVKSKIWLIHVWTISVWSHVVVGVRGGIPYFCEKVVRFLLGAHCDVDLSHSRTIIAARYEP